MLYRILICIVISMFSLSMLANEDQPKSVTLCSGEKMSWDMYLLNKKMLSHKYDMEVEFVEFVSHTVAVVNNQTGSWSSVVDMPLVASAAANMPDGRIMTWSARDKLAFGGDQGRTWTAIFDPATNTSTEALITNTGHDMFCPSTNLLPDGRIMVTGGSSSAKSSTFDPMTGGWSSMDNLNIARGYHAGLTHASGATFIIGGSWNGGQFNKHSEVWTEKTGWYQLPGVLANAITEGIVSNQPEFKDDYFPWLWNAPNGKIFHAGPSERMHWIDPTGVGSWEFAGLRSNSPYKTVGMSVMYDKGKIITLAGAEDFEMDTNASSSCYTIDINTDNAQAAQTDNLSFSRAYGNAVVLPNGNVLALGGQGVTDIFSDNESRMIPELWNPSTGLWTQMEEMDVPRNYHSTAILMIDGRVFIAGGGLCNTCSTNHPDAQIFSPPYLFNANGNLASRPSITSAPTVSDWNTSITVNTNGVVADFSLVRMSAVTHSTNNGQRRIPLAKSTIGTNQYSLAIPDRNILPPGNYMLFALKNNGVPSIAKVINIGDDINDCTPQSHPNLGGTGLTGTYYNNTTLSGTPVLEKNDPTVNFNWGAGNPASGVNANNFSVNWEGIIRVPRDGYYTFYTNSDDGVRLTVNGRMMVDNWTDHGATIDQGFVELLAGQDYEIILDYYEATGNAVIQLQWSGPGIDKAAIASQYLFPADPCEDNNFTIACESNINSSGYILVPNCNVSACPGDNVRLSVNPNGFPTSWTGPNGFTSNSNAPLISSNLNNNHYGDYVATVDVNGCIKSETISLTAGAACDPCFANGGDSDNDGICNDDDCEPYNANLPATPGANCNDGNSDTTNDVIQSDGCTCEGTPVGNNSCNATYTISGSSITVSGLTNPINATKIITEGYDTYWECNSWTSGCGTSETINNIPNGTYYISLNTYDAGWNIICNIFESFTIGSSCIDNDNDGVCAAIDCNDNDSSLPATVGSGCNDGNPNTTNDIIQSDGCTCEGTPTGNNNCNADYSVSGGSITFTGLNNPINAVKLIDLSYTTYWECNTWSDPCGTSETVNNIPAGDYYVSLNTYDAEWNVICNIFEIVTIGNGGGCTDNDNDGVCANVDCNDNNANLPAAVGSSCNDGDSNTTNDVIQSDGCTCAGTPGGGGCNVNISENGGVITITGLVGTNAKIFNSSWVEQWGCNPWTSSPCSNSESYNAGNGTFFVSISSTDCNIFEIVETGGSNCPDSDNDGICNDQDCAPSDPNIPASAGTACNDGNSNTTNDVIQSDGCTCQGTTIGGGNDCSIAFSNTNNSITVTGLTDPIVTMLLVDNFYNPIWDCGTFATPCNATETVNNLSPGNYFILYDSYDSGWNLLCDGEESISIGIAPLISTTSDTEDSSDFKATNNSEVYDIDVYPNPASDLINIELNDSFLDKKGSLEIYNAFGSRLKVIEYNSFSSNVVQVDVHDYTSGIYTVMLNVENQQRIAKKFIVRSY